MRAVCAMVGVLLGVGTGAGLDGTSGLGCDSR